ncbi:hypothetical protein [Cellulomonas massiliensis]|nr:hypothetical protein [Cellulomonas massiliensis]
MPQPERPPVTLAERYAGWRWPDRLAAVPTQHAARGDDEGASR